MPEDNASCLLCAKDAFFFVDTTASTCTTAEQDGGWYSGAEEESASSSAAAFVAELIGGEADYSPLSDYSDRLRRPRCSGRLHCMDSQGDMHKSLDSSTSFSDWNMDGACLCV
uniref:Uncharacterized protein n=1 Tax=Aegilops tauschii subsp. strangulata TaxID=200361 RepID=A0A453I349_AEGTS